MAYNYHRPGDLPIIGFARDDGGGGTEPAVPYHHHHVSQSPYFRAAGQWGPNTQRLFPYLDADPARGQQLHRGWFRQRIVGSGFSEAFISSLVFYGIAALNCILWELGVWPHSWFEAVQHIDILDSPFATFVFVFIAILPTVLLVVFEYYQGSVKKYTTVADHIRLSADILPRFVLEKRQDMAGQKCATIVYGPSGPVPRPCSVLESLAESGHLLKTLIYAVKHRFRKDGENFSAAALPLPDHLQREWSVLSNTYTRSQNRYLECLMTMYEKRLSLLLEGTPSGPNQFSISSAYTLQDHVTQINACIAEVYFYRTIWAHAERFSDIARVAVWIWLVYLPFRYLPVFGAWTLLWFAIPDLVVNAMFVVSVKRLNAFNDAKDSPYVFYDLGAIAHETAEHVDRSFAFATLEKEQLSANPVK